MVAWSHKYWHDGTGTTALTQQYDQYTTSSWIACCGLQVKRMIPGIQLPKQRYGLSGDMSGNYYYMVTYARSGDRAIIKPVASGGNLCRQANVA